MSHPRTITGSINAWLPRHATPEALNGSPESVLGAVCLYDPGDDARREAWRSMGYVYIGEARVTIDVVDPEVLAADAIERLAAEQGKIMYEATASAAAIAAKIKRLQDGAAA